MIVIMRESYIAYVKWILMADVLAIKSLCLVRGAVCNTTELGKVPANQHYFLRKRY